MRVATGEVTFKPTDNNYGLWMQTVGLDGKTSRIFIRKTEYLEFIRLAQAAMGLDLTPEPEVDYGPPEGYTGPWAG